MHTYEGWQVAPFKNPLCDVSMGMKIQFPRFDAYFIAPAVLLARYSENAKVPRSVKKVRSNVTFYLGLHVDVAITRETSCHCTIVS